MKKKLLTLAFGLLLAVGWTNVASAQLKAEYSTKEYVKVHKLSASNVSNPVAKQEHDAPIPLLNQRARSDFRFQSETLDLSKRAPMRRAPRRAENNITAKATLTFDEADAITYDWVDANGNPQNSKLTEPATTPEQIAYLLGTSYMNPNIPGLKYSAVYDMDNPYPNIEFGWDIPNNSRWPSEFVGSGSGSGTTTTTQTWSWVGADNGTTLPSGWSFVDSNCGLGSNGDGTYYVGVTSGVSSVSSFAITIPASTFTGYSNIQVVVRAIADQGYTSQTISVNGDSKPVSDSQLANYTWTNVDASNGITIDPSSSYTGLVYITITGTKTTTSTTGRGLTIASPDSAGIFTITVKSGNTTLQSWNSVTAYQNNQFNSDNGYYTIPNWTCSQYFWGLSTNGYVSGLYGYLYDNHIHIPASLLGSNSSVTVTINAFGENGGERLVVNGVEKTLTTSAADYTWTVTDLSAGTGTVIPPDENGYTIFLVKVNDNVPAAMHSTYTYAWDNANNTWTSASLIDWLDTYIDEVQLLTDGTRLNEDTEDAGTMFSYSGELGRFYFLGKGNSIWFGSSEAAENPHMAPTYDMYEEFSPTSTDNGADITDFYSKLLYGNSYNVIHDCRGMNYFQHYFTMSGLAGDEHRSMTNLIFWLPDNRNSYNDRNYNEEYLPHVGLYTITLEAEAQRADNYTTENRMYDVTCEWVSSLNSILDFDVDQDYELWVYIYDEQGNPVADYMVLDRLQMQDKLIHNETTFTYQVPQTAESQTIVYRVKGWPKDATNTPGNNTEHPEKGTFFALSNLDPVLIPGYNDFLQLGVEHYESDFALDEEYNYYRNFLTIANQDDDNEPLTAARIENGEGEYELYRFDASDLLNPKDYVKAADLKFTVGNNKVEYLIDYTNQFYVDDAQPQVYNEYNNAYLTGYKNNYDALGCPTSGEIATISGGGGEIPTVNVYDDITIKPRGVNTNFVSILVKSDQNAEVVKWTTSNQGNLPDGLTCSSSWTYSASYGGAYTSGTLTVDGTLLTGMTNVQVVIRAFGDNAYQYITVNGVQTNITTSAGEYTWDITPSGTSSGDVFTLLNDFLNNATYTQVGQVVFTLPWKSIQVKLQDTSAGTSSGYFMIQNGGKLRFVMPAGYNNANVKFVIHNAPVTSNYYDGTFTLSSSTGDTQTIIIPSGGTYVDGDKDYEAIFQGISSGDVITITGTHTVDGEEYGYSPDFTYIKVYVQGGTDGISENDALNLDAVKFVDQFKAETKEDKHPYRYGYVLKSKDGNKESGQPKIPVQHTNSTVHGFYSLNEINGDTKAPLFDKNIMNGEVNMTLSREPEIYYYTLNRKPSNVNNAQWEDVSKLQKNEDDSYREMFTFLPQYDDQVCNPPTIASTPWIVERYDNYDVKQGNYNAYMNYVPVIWTHGDQKNRRILWNIENRHNSYGSPIWKTGVAEVTLTSATAERQDAPSTSWTYNNEDCNLYMLNNIVAEAKMPTVNNVKYVPYMFRIFVKSNNGKLRGYQYVPENLDDPVAPGEHYAGAPIDDDELQCVWSGYVNDPRNVPAEGEDYGPNGVSISYSGNTITFNKIKVYPAEGSDWDPENKDNAVFAGTTDIIQGEGEAMSINKNDLTILVRFYYIVEGFDASMPSRGEGEDPAGYGVEGGGDPSPWTAISDVIYNATVESVTYVNTLGMTSDKPFDGVNIVITRYSNGMTTTSKVVR